MKLHSIFIHTVLVTPFFFIQRFFFCFRVNHKMKNCCITGEIRLTTALDGSTLYCCPECHMAYPERELLEQHLLGNFLILMFKVESESYLTNLIFKYLSQVTHWNEDSCAIYVAQG